MPKKLALDQVFGNSAAIDDNERLPGPWTEGMYRLGGHFFSCACIAGDKHRVVGLAGIEEMSEDLAHGG